VTSFNTYCKTCDYWGAELTVSIDIPEEQADQTIDDQAYIASLDTLRAKNFDFVLDALAKQAEHKNLSILDVGCASGSFMVRATSRGYTVQGVEPNKKLCAIARGRGLNVVGDFFPPAQGFQQKFDVIIFNDVFEHIPDINRILESCKSNLKEGGMLILNLPNSDGLIFKLAKLLALFKMQGPWDRLWQVMFKTPHLHYFNEASLNRLVGRHSFRPLIKKIEIPTIELNGLWDRLTIDRSLTGLIKNCVV
jgi:2-polyprenyl-3-methyl-5-hydroxy-6-metoxy-1,4-benzoquinol methylase